VTALLTLDEAAQQLRFSRRTLSMLIAQRRIGYLRLGRRVYLQQDDVDRFITSRHVEPVAELAKQ
jgi:excisionase family DNA binding protein